MKRDQLQKLSGYIIEADELNRLLTQDDTLVLDCRFSLMDINEGSANYKQSHVPTAHYAHLDHDLSSKIVDGVTGRHPLPEQSSFLATLQAWGANSTSNIVVYDDAPGAIAARAWWLCQWIGHQHVAVLNGGFRAWQEQGFPVSSEIPAATRGNIELGEALVNLVTADKVLESNRLLVDARDPERYRGDTEPLDTVAGHIPGAINLPFAGNIASGGRFAEPEILKSRFDSLVQQADQKTVTHYCGSGVTAAHNILVMYQLGLTDCALYAGSWSEWIVDPERSVASG